MNFEIPYKGDVFDVEWNDSTDFESVAINGVAGFIFDDKGRICLIKVQDERGWTLPGGGSEKEDNSPEDTFIRETEEEADLELKDIQRLEYWKSCSRKNPKRVDYLARFIAKVKKIKDQTIDPAYDIVPERIFIKSEDFNKYVDWGDNGEFQLKKALEKLKNTMLPNRAINSPKAEIEKRRKNNVVILCLLLFMCLSL